MVYRIYVEKKKEFAHDAASLKNDIVKMLQIDGISDLRIVNRYDAENLDKKLFDYAVKTVFSEPQTDIASDKLEYGNDDVVFAVEYLPGQFDQRANSASECIQIISKGERPEVKTAKVYVLSGSISKKDIEEIKRYVINPVEAREASLEDFTTLKVNYEIPTEVETLTGFIELEDEDLENFLTDYGLAMDIADLKFCQQYFRSEDRDPTITEIKVIDTYWSDHCRHTTFNTTIDGVKFEDPMVQKTYDEYMSTRKELGRIKPVTLMDIGTIAAKYLKSKG